MSFFKDRSGVPVDRDGDLRPALALLVGGAAFMELLDATVITVAIPSMATALGVEPVRLNLTITAYLLTVAILIPVGGWLADRFGAKLIFSSAIVVFTISSLLCGLADGLLELVVARILQGIGGAMMLPVGRTIVVRSVRPSELVRAMAILTTPAIFAPIIGPPLGGALVTFGSWRLIFFLNIPIGIIGLLATLALVREEKTSNMSSLDLKGLILLGSGLAGLIFGFEAVSNHLLSAFGVAVIIFIGFGFCMLYAIHARATERPIIDMSLMAVQTFSASLLGGGLCRISLGAMPFLMAMLLQIGLGIDAFAAGLITLASALGALANKPTIRPVVVRFGMRNTIVFAAVANGASLILYGFHQIQSSMLLLIAAFFVGGFFRSLLFTTLNALSYVDVPHEKAGHATGLVSVAQQLTLSLGTALAAMLLSLSLHLRGGLSLSSADASAAFFCVGALSIAAIPWFTALPERSE